MKVFHATTPSALRSIKAEGVLKAQPHLIRTYDDYGQEDWEYKPRAFVCLNKADGEQIKQTLSDHHGEKYVLGSFQVEDVPLSPDPKFPGQGHFATQDLKLK